MRRIVILFWGGVLGALLVADFSCKKSPNNNNNNNSGPDSVLINIGNNIILPAYQSLSAKVNSLDSAIADFNSSPNAPKLAGIQTLFINAYIGWQSVSEYNGFGPASTNQPLLSGLNLFPVTASKIDSNIIVGSYSVNILSNATAKGFPALDYLLFGGGSNTLTNYTTGANAANRKQYLAAVSADIKSEVNAAYNSWSPTGGNYINTFVKGTGNSISSSEGLLINSLDQDLEVLKNDCFGIPLGKQPPGATLPVFPTEVEAYYSGISAQLALAQLKAVQAIYLGTNTAGSPMGLNNYLVKANAKYHGGNLSDTMTVDFASAVSALQAVPDPLSSTIQSNPAPSDAVYAQMQLLVVLMKTDMPSSLGVLITYGDNDGD